MDKHDRPFTCQEPNYKITRGFTYAGGLLRHQREAHRKNLNRPPIMCLYADCNRSSGNGFTRQENLREQLGRRHLHTHDVSSSSSMLGNPCISIGVRANHLPVTAVGPCHNDSGGERLSEANDVAWSQ